MNTEINSQRIEVRGIPVEVVRKEIKNLHVAVYPPSGRVRVAAPLCLDDEAVRLAVVSRLGWIRRRRAEFEGQTRESQREFVTGESHYFEGRRYRLDVIERDVPPTVKLLNNTRLELGVRPNSDREAREAVLHRWYRRHLRNQLPPLVAKWEPKLGVTVEDVRIKKMKTLWGSCNAEAKRIWLNLELAKKPSSCPWRTSSYTKWCICLSAITTDRFRELMDNFIPQWRTYRDELNRAPLAHENWRY